MKSQLHDLACDMVEICTDNQIDLKVEWMSRKEEQIQFCDNMRKDVDTSDYKISWDKFDRLRGKFGPFRVDMFASDWTKQMVPFYSKFLCQNSSGVDAFCSGLVLC